jgi:hypothetical protein
LNFGPKTGQNHEKRPLKYQKYTQLRYVVMDGSCLQGARFLPILEEAKFIDKYPDIWPKMPQNGQKFGVYSLFYQLEAGSFRASFRGDLFGEKNPGKWKN